MIDFELIDKMQDVITIVAVPVATILLVWLVIEVRLLKNKIKDVIK
jgi:hypothetical protein